MRFADAVLLAAVTTAPPILPASGAVPEPKASAAMPKRSAGMFNPTAGQQHTQTLEDAPAHVHAGQERTALSHWKGVSPWT